jgi:predicted metalloendopeptidase
MYDGDHPERARSPGEEATGEEIVRIGTSNLLAAGTAGLLCLASAAAAGERAGAANIGEWGVDLTTRDSGTRPQDDFFRYANGAWLDEFEIPGDLPGYGSFIALHLRSEEDVEEIIREAGGGAPGSVARKIADLYADFLDREAIEAAGLEPVRADLERIAAAKSPDDVARLLAGLSRVGGTTPFAFYVDQDAKNPDRYLPHFLQSGIGLPDRDYFLDRDNPRFASAREALRAHRERMLQLAGTPDPAGAAERVLALEERLAEAHWPSEETRDVDRTYNVRTPAQLEREAPGFPWRTYLKALGMEKQEDLMILQPSAYRDMAAVFAATPVADWQAYLRVTLIASHAAFLPREVDDAQFRFVSAAVTGTREQRSREKRAVQFVNGAMGEAVGRLYVEKHFPPEAKRRAHELVDNLLVAMGQRIDGLDWMSAETKVRARDKLSRFNVKIGYPDEWRDYSGLEIRRGDLVGNANRAAEFEHRRQVGKLGRPVDRGEWLMSPQTVNAYYNPPMNEIVFPAAILQPPFFDPPADDAVNYGGIGAVIGHEIGHGFDDQGRKSDGDGVLRDWWTEEDARRFGERSDRLVEQYDAFSPLEGMFVNGRLTLGENIGDVGGLEIAHHAYRLGLGGSEPPVLDGLTGDQRFFLGYAQIWKGKARDEMMATLVASNPHSPVEFRVNGALRNVDAWYAAFDVREGDAMYLAPAERARIW